MRFVPVPLNSPAPTSSARRGVLSILTVGLQGTTRFVSNWLIGRVSTATLGKTAGDAVFGQVSSATSLAFALNTLWPSSTPGAASKFIARSRGAGDDAAVHAVARHLAGRVLLATLVLAAVAVGVAMIHYRWSWWEALCVAAMLITFGTSQFARGVHFGAGQVARATKADVMVAVVGIALTGLLLALGVRNLTLTLPMSFALALQTLVCWPWTGRGRPEPALRREIDTFVTLAAVGSFASAGMFQLSQLVAFGVSPAAAGVYGKALQLVTPISLVTGAVTMALYPSMAEAHGAADSDRLRQQTDRATRIFVGVLVPAFGACAIAARPIMDLVWGRGHADSAQLMPVFCLALLLTNSAQPAISSITAGEHRNMWYSVLLSYAGLATALVAWRFFSPPFGLLGVVGGYAVGAAVTALSLIAVAWRLYGQRWVGLLASLLGAVAAIAALSWWRQTSDPDPLLDVAVAAAFGLAWAAAHARLIRSAVRSRRAGATTR